MKKSILNLMFPFRKVQLIQTNTMEFLTWYFVSIPQGTINTKPAYWRAYVARKFPFRKVQLIHHVKQHFPGYYDVSIPQGTINTPMDAYTAYIDFSFHSARYN